MADDSRIADLERRVASDPASIAFAQLAEEYRRAGRLADAVRVCREGLARHSTYPSARVTLGRALFAQGLHEDAQRELAAAAAEAPDNVLVQRALDELRRVRPAPAVAPGDPGLRELEDWLAALRADRASRHSPPSRTPDHG